MSAEMRAVTLDEEGVRLDRWFRRHFPGVTQSSIQKWCRTGQVRVDGHRAEAATRLAPGQQVRVPPLPMAPPPQAPKPPDPRLIEEMESLVLHRDDQLLVLDKPAGLPVQGGPGITRHLDGLLDALRFGSPERPRLVHRLDRDTSGVLVLARTPGVAAKLASAFRTRDVEKLYWALVAGRPSPAEGRVNLPLRREGGPRGERTRAADPDDADATHAITDFRTLDNAGQRLAWLELKPLTGRTHQLRVHCVALKAPIVGDLKYHEPDQNNAFTADIYGLPEQLHLHARALDLPHPAGGRLRVEAPLPPHFRESFRILGFHASPPHAPERH